MISVRSFVRRAVLMIAITAVGTSCAGCNDDTEPVVVTPAPPDYSNIGRANGPPCVKTGDDSDVNKCKGQPPRDFVDSAPVGALNAFLNNPTRWTAESGPIEMEPDSGPTKQTFWVSAVQESRRFEFRQHDSNAYLVARIRADPAGPKDRMYKIGGFGDTLEQHFYLVVRGYDASDTTEPPDADSVGPSRKISRWEIYGITARGQPTLRLISSGQVRWCGHAHDATPTGSEATVQYCPRDSPTASASAQRLPVQLQFASSIQLFRDPPLWFTCGLGCCIADMELTQ